jgi:AmmeMemoRadiSam system protein B/AmmeMemoRadiSam system protein A
MTDPVASLTLASVTPIQRQALLRATAEVIRCATLGHTARFSDETLGGLGCELVWGLFVTVKCQDRLRGCTGACGRLRPLGEVLLGAAVRSATSDPRFPPLREDELPHLHMDLWLLHQPEPITARAEARLAEIQLGIHGLQITRGVNRGLLLPCVPLEHGWGKEEFLNHVCLKAKLPETAWREDTAELIRFRADGLEGMFVHLIEESGISPDQGHAREPAVAGTFYPAGERETRRMVESLLGKPAPAEPWSGAMVPHAGWRYSGRLAADVLKRIAYPSDVVVLGPKHTRWGANWAVDPHSTWSLPTGDVKSNPHLARQLVRAVPGMELDPVAHQQEHAIEVELPFIQRLAPDARVVGVAIGPASKQECEAISAGLARVIEDQPEPPLLIISSDMNHFADDESARRLDALALDRLYRLDPDGLYDVCTENQITMCGMRPAVIVLKTLRKLGRLKSAKHVGYATSGDVSGDRSRVVGYAGMLFC